MTRYRIVSGGRNIGRSLHMARVLLIDRLWRIQQIRVAEESLRVGTDAIKSIYASEGMVWRPDK